MVSGYPEHWFVDQNLITEFSCPVCLDVARDCVETRECGHLFCLRCVEAVVKANGLCPLDQLPVAMSDLIPFASVRRKILDLKVRCPNGTEEACAWQGRLADMDTHQAVCTQRIVECPYARYGCDVRIKWCESESHVQTSAVAHLALVEASHVQLQEKLQAYITRFGLFDAKQPEPPVVVAEEQNVSDVVIYHGLENSINGVSSSSSSCSSCSSSSGSKNGSNGSNNSSNSGSGGGSVSGEGKVISSSESRIFPGVSFRRSRASMDSELADIGADQFIPHALSCPTLSTSNFFAIKEQLLELLTQPAAYWTPYNSRSEETESRRHRHKDKMRNIECFYQTSPGGRFYVKGKMELPYSPSTVLAALMDVKNKGQWDPLLQSGSILQTLDEYSWLHYQLYRAVWPVRPRDFVMVGNWSVYPLTGALLQVNVSDESQVADTSKTVRGYHKAGFLLEPVSQGGNLHTRFTMVEHNDLKGTIPDGATRMVAKSWLGVAETLATYLSSGVTFDTKVLDDAIAALSHRPVN